jgi:hypothetical protein
MAESTVNNKADQWRERIAEQERSGLSVKQFCEQRGVAVWSFYGWRKRLRQTTPVRFALVDRGAECREPDRTADLEVVFATGERLRIRSGVDSATLRTVLRALRG